MSDDLERQLKQELARLHYEYRRQSAPVVERLARIEALKPPRPVWVNGSWFVMNPDVLATIMPPEEVAAIELPGDMMHRLQRERTQMLHVLRMVLAAGGDMPRFLYQQIEQTVKDMRP